MKLPYTHKHILCVFTTLTLVVIDFITSDARLTWEGVTISNSAAGFSEQLKKLQLLSDFDNEQIIHAMGTTEFKSFLILGSE